MKELPVLLLTGYLGSGKTTLLNRILNNRRGIRFAVIVNDIGEVNIDADLIQKGGVVDTSDDSLVALQNGCICCTLKMDLIKQIDDIIAMDRFDYLVIEASGICEPAPIAATICSMPMMAAKDAVGGAPRLDCICTVVDALRLRDEFGSGDQLQNHDLDEDDIENLIIQQIEFCNLILLNKASEVTAEERGRIRSVIRAIQPEAAIIDCDYCDVDLARLLDTHLFDFDRVSGSATWIKELEAPLDEDEHHDDHDHDHDDHDHDHDDHDHDHDHDDHDHDHDDHDHDDEHHDEHHDDHHGHGHCHHHHHDEGEAEEYGIGTFVYYRRKGFDIEKFDRFVGEMSDAPWGRGIIRSKGMCYFTANPDMCYIFEQAGRQKSITESGRWYATAPEEELQEYLRRDPALRRDWDPEYGDRMQKLVFIGRNLDRAAITAALDLC